MFVLLLSYIKPLVEVDALMREHVAWLGQQYEAGRFVVSGRQVPRTGGVIVARGEGRRAERRVRWCDGTRPLRGDPRQRLRDGEGLV